MKHVKIGEISEVKGGKRLPAGRVLQDSKTEHPYLRIVDFREDGIDQSNIMYITGDIYESIKKYTINDEDVYISIAGTTGRVGIVPANLSGANLTENAAKISNLSKIINQNFLMYYLRSPEGQNQIQSKTGGTSQPKLALERIRDILIPLEKITTQRKIASILSTYDDLLENNLHRIALLEETARLIYQEWFVRFQFPGYENTKMVNGVPEGWEIVPVGSALTLQRGFDLPSQSRHDGVVPIFASTGINGHHNIVKVQGPGVVTGRSGTLGKVHYIDGDFWPLNTTLWVKEFKLVTPIFAYFLLSELTLSQYNGGVSVPTLDRKVVHRISMILPPSKIQTLFGEYVTPIFSQMQNLTLYNQKLKQARDLLLPKLMSGEVMV